MPLLTRGQRIPLPPSACQSELSVQIHLSSSRTIDLACFGLDSAGKLSDSRYLQFFNSPCSPCGNVRQVNNSAFAFHLDRLPATIDRLVITAAIDGAGAMGELGDGSLNITSAGNEVARCAVTGADFQQERALMLLELYRKDGGWRINTILQGFNEGLDALVRHFGGTVKNEPAAPAPTPASSSPAATQLQVSLEKITRAAPELVSLAKKAAVSLEKAGVQNLKARVVLVLDASGSMNEQYKKGRVQELINRLVPLAVNFDDDGTLECWAFGDYPQRLSPVGLHNFRNYIERDHGGWREWRLGSRINTESRVIEEVIRYVTADGDRSPVYVLFISDGGIHDSRKITNLIKDAARLPAFWQFVGLAGRGYGILEKLDEMTGRVVDNCNFFALDDLHQISEEALYDRMMAEFPQWLKDAKTKGILA